MTDERAGILDVKRRGDIKTLEWAVGVVSSRDRELRSQSEAWSRWHRLCRALMAELNFMEVCRGLGGKEWRVLMCVF